MSILSSSFGSSSLFELSSFLFHLCPHFIGHLHFWDYLQFLLRFHYQVIFLFQGILIFGSNLKGLFRIMKGENRLLWPKNIFATLKHFYLEKILFGWITIRIFASMGKKSLFCKIDLVMVVSKHVLLRLNACFCFGLFSIVRLSQFFKYFLIFVFILIFEGFLLKFSIFIVLRAVIQ